MARTLCTSSVALCFLATVALLSGAVTAAQNCTSDEQCAPNGCCSADTCTMTPPDCAAMACPAIACTSKGPLCIGWGCGCDRSTGQCIVRATPQRTLVPQSSLPAPADGRCFADTDCHPTSCCHSTTCSAGPAAVCNMMCTYNCVPGTLDCGQASCGCNVATGKCRVVPAGSTPSNTAATAVGDDDVVEVPLWLMLVIAAVGGASLTVAVGCTVRWCRAGSNKNGELPPSAVNATPTRSAVADVEPCEAQADVVVVIGTSLPHVPICEASHCPDHCSAPQ